MPEPIQIQKAASGVQPWPWVAARLAKGEAIVAEPNWAGVRLRLTKSGPAWSAPRALGADVVNLLLALPTDAPDMELEGVMIARQGALWLSKADTEEVLGGAKQAEVAFSVTDCLAFGGQDLRGRALALRRVYAEKAIEQLGAGWMRLSDQQPVTGKVTLERSRRWAREQEPTDGVILKTRSAAYGETYDFEPWIAVDAAAPAESGPESAPRCMRLVKAEALQQKVYGIVFEPEVEDTQGDITAAEDIEAACHQFLTDYRAGRTELWLDHNTPLRDDDAVLVENFIAPADMTIGDQRVRKASWLQVWHVKSAELWSRVAAGQLTGFSFGGSGVRGALRKRAGGVSIERDKDGITTRIRTAKGDYLVERDQYKRAVGLIPEHA